MEIPLQLLEGIFILNEIIKSGNFGANIKVNEQSSNKLQKAWKKLTHNVKFLTSYPQEVIWFFPFMVWETLRYKIPHK